MAISQNTAEIVVRAIDQASATLKRIAASTKTSMEQTAASVNRVNASIEPMMAKVATAAKFAGAAAATGFTALVAGSIKGASSLEQYRNTLDTVMRDTVKAGETMAWAVDFANKTPFETDSIIGATVRLTAYGLEAQKVMPAIGDMASVMNKDIMQAVEAVADAQTGELERYSFCLAA